MELLLLGKNPIAPDKAAGSDARYDPVFEELQGEVDKLSIPSAKGAVDWKKVVNLASEILAQKSKDLLAASYLAVGLIHTRKLEGLSIGVEVYLDLLEHFWETLFPPKTRMRGRVGAVEWWRDKAAIALEDLKETPLAQDQINHLEENLEKIEQFLQKNAGVTFSFSSIWDFLKPATPVPSEEARAETPLQAPAEAPKEQMPPAVPRKVPEAAKAEIPGEISSIQEAQEVLSYGFKKVREATVYLRNEDLSNPRTYRCTRTAVWSVVDALPSATNGRTMIPPPPPYDKNPLNDLRTKGNDEGLVRSAEGKIVQYPFWIDLNRWVAEALTRLGSRYEKAGEAVCQETAFFIHRIAGIEELSFADGTPFADPETKEWLKRISFGAESTAAATLSPGEPASPTKDEDPIEKEVAEAQNIAQKGNLLEAVKRLQEKIGSSFSQKERLLWRFALARVLMNRKQPKLVLSQLEQILKDIDLYRLEEYDPIFALKGLKLAWMGFESQPEKIFKEKAADMLYRIAKLDPAEVIRLGKG